MCCSLICSGALNEPIAHQFIITGLTFAATANSECLKIMQLKITTFFYFLFSSLLALDPLYFTFYSLPLQKMTAGVLLILKR